MRNTASIYNNIKKLIAAWLMGAVFFMLTAFAHAAEGKYFGDPDNFGTSSKSIEDVESKEAEALSNVELLNQRENCLSDASCATQVNTIHFNDQDMISNISYNDGLNIVFALTPDDPNNSSINILSGQINRISVGRRSIMWNRSNSEGAEVSYKSADKLGLEKNQAEFLDNLKTLPFIDT